MPFLNDLKKRRVQGFRAEFVPSRIQYASVCIYAIGKALIARNLLRFTATNPGFNIGGLYPSSKREILRQLPNKRVPRTYVIESQSIDPMKLNEKIKNAGIDYPMIIKPDNGLRGLGVEVLHNYEDFQTMIIDSGYFTTQKSWGTWLIQEFINYPLEVGVFYVRIPGSKEGTITGIVAKEFLQAIGNGKNTLGELVALHDRACFHVSTLKQRFVKIRDSIPEVGSVIDLVEIGTHNRGSTFIDASEHINLGLIKLFDEISSHINGFYYGRYDIRVAGWEALQEGDFKIIELNTTYSEPTWMYDPSYSFFQAQRILISHRSKMYQVATANHQKGVDYASFEEWRKSRIEFKQREGN